MIVFLNGKFLPAADAVVPLNDRGFLLGDGLFETMRVANGRPFRCAQHLERLTRGADFLKIKLSFTPKEIQKFAGELIEQNKLSEAILRVTLTRGAGARGYSPKNSGPPTLALTLHPLPPVNADEPVQWSLVTSSFRLPASDALASFKTTSKILNVLARAEAEEQGADEALLLNANGEVAETAGGNIFWVYQDKICTVPTGRGVLPGITRAVVLEICQSLGLETNKCVVKPEQLRNAEGIFVTQSALGIVPVAAFDGVPVAPSPLVDQITAAYHEVLTKE
ncbi:MAG TPA: 2-keto-4-methylthiobutyrate aminotransferase [Verrucomicrobia subdivision 3 bacterium]|nr:2-keto-4-methylthiobutyrate aminotransferase [Limisphaerales bacterium]